MKKPPVDDKTFCPLPLLVFYILPCWKFLRISAWTKTFSMLLQENSVGAKNKKS
jgi:hypothetical protein